MSFSTEDGLRQCAGMVRFIRSVSLLVARRRSYLTSNGARDVSHHIHACLEPVKLVLDVVRCEGRRVDSSEVSALLP